MLLAVRYEKPWPGLWLRQAGVSLQGGEGFLIPPFISS
jgi:hypothetical protein